VANMYKVVDHAGVARKQLFFKEEEAAVSRAAELNKAVSDMGEVGVRFAKYYEPHFIVEQDNIVMPS
jgi:hypothetical protein